MFAARLTGGAVDAPWRAAQRRRLPAARPRVPLAAAARALLRALGFAAAGLVRRRAGGLALAAAGRVRFFAGWRALLALPRLPAAARAGVRRAADPAVSPPRSCSRIAGFSSVDTSWVISSPRAMAFNSRRMILPERVLGRLSAKRMSSGLAIAPSSLPTQSRSSLVSALVSPVGGGPRSTT